jgi:hypothetical protein
LDSIPLSHIQAYFELYEVECILERRRILRFVKAMHKAYLKVSQDISNARAEKQQQEERQKNQTRGHSPKRAARK